MKQYHLHPDKCFIIREEGNMLACLEEQEIAQFSQLSLPQGCTEILIVGDGLVYATINRAMEAIQHNPIQELMDKEQEIVAFYQAKLVAQQEQQEEQ
jgi:hypothetical protein